ncbi:ABC transporter ATP-binding protein [Lyngbya sp. PCC 8106]|uniref:ABC transporter ATP-binding protein n=1 Tax=Lyngbya sp. (strain PCC 8106) TaxID=313612 RepID=UPI0000EA8AD3|nr:ABC transporter ATP-binding protein [Lyngbya sp. PCC 8106]EAW37247.1 probable ABC transporter protein, ATP-binding component [Lyngbya sp. PCC 8106]
MSHSTTSSHALPDQFFSNYRSDRPFRTLLNLYQKDKKYIGLSMFFYIIKHSPEWIRPLIIANIIDIISSPNTHSLSELWFNGAFLAFSIIQNTPTHYLHIRFLSTATHSMEYNLRSAITRQLQYLSIGFHQHRNSGAIQNKLLRDVEAVALLTNQLFQYLPSSILTIIIAIIITAFRAPEFLIFFLGTIPVAVTLIRHFRTPIRSRNSVFRQQMESTSAYLIEMLKLIPITRAHGAEEAEIDRTEQRLKSLKEASIKLDLINALANAASWVSLRSFNLICLLTSAWLAYTGKWGITVGDVVLLTGYFDSITGSVVQILGVLPQIGKGFEALSSIGEVLECPDVEHNHGKTPVQHLKGEFSFESVCYVYPESKNQTAITDFSLQVKPGETIAIVGPSGAGKSTLLNLIIGFLRPTSGKIKLDKQDMNELDLRTYRQFLSVVSQETILFEGTVRENILYGKDTVSEQRLKQVVQESNADEFIQNLPHGLQTQIGENGVKLSGGQRQRIAIARALIRDPRVLILDEATSSLDTVSESLIQEALDRLVQNRTTFIVAHRLSTVRKADRIVVLEHGKIIEVGSHEQLLKNQGLFSILHALQT